MNYKIQFTGPTGTNTVESALKLSRMVKRRSNIVSFTNGYHGLTLGALAVTGNDFYRDESFGYRANAAHMPYHGFLGKDVDTIHVFRRFLEDTGSGVDLPAAVIVETIQGEGGIKNRQRNSGCATCRICAGNTRSFSLSTIFRWVTAGRERISVSKRRA